MTNSRELYIKFNKARNLGSLISDTINFLKFEGKPFFTAVLRISIIPIILAIASGTYYQIYELERPVTFSSGFLSQYEYMTEWPYILSELTSYIAIGFMVASAYAYIKSYWENKGTINFSDINTLALRKAFPYAGLQILNLIVIGIGLIFLLIPGIYIAVVLSISGCLLVFENRDVFDAFGHSFDFVKGYWWETFGNILVFQILIAVILLALNIPLFFYGYNNTFIADDPIYIGLLILSQIIESFFYLVTALFIAFIYFDIYERKHPSQDQIDFIGRE
jgi:hypothetical protein